MERKIGEIFEYKGEWYQCVESYCDTCIFCCFCGCCNSYNCTPEKRSDGKNVIFKKLEKVGEPITIYGEKFQLLNIKDRWCNGCALRSEGFCEFPEEIDGRKCECGAGGIYVEIKQNQEDMEEKKLNLKPFDIKKAKEGYPVCTRDGRKARIICFDRIDNTGCNLPIVALVQCEETEVLRLYRDDGKRNVKVDLALDLMMLPEKKEGWVNVYKGIDGEITIGQYPYQTREACEKMARPEDGYIDTIKVVWED